MASSHFILRLRGIFLLFARRVKVSLFRSICFECVRLMLPSSIMYGAKTLGCDVMKCLSDSRSGGRGGSLGDASLTSCSIRIVEGGLRFGLMLSVIVGRRFFRIECIDEEWLAAVEVGSALYDILKTSCIFGAGLLPRVVLRGRASVTLKGVKNLLIGVEFEFPSNIFWGSVLLSFPVKSEAAVGSLRSVDLLVSLGFASGTKLFVILSTLWVFGGLRSVRVLLVLRVVGAAVAGNLMIWGSGVLGGSFLWPWVAEEGDKVVLWWVIAGWDPCATLDGLCFVRGVITGVAAVLIP